MSIRRHRIVQWISIALLFVGGAGMYFYHASRAAVVEKRSGDNGLIGYWSFDEGSGGTAGDASASGNTGTLTNGPSWIEGGARGKALNFDGTDDHVQRAGSSYAPYVNNFTIAFWAKANTAHEIDAESTGGAGSGINGQKYVIDPPHGGSSNAGIGVSMGTNGVSVYEHGDTHMPAVLVHQAALAGWRHIAVVYISKQPRLYIDGALVRTGSVSTRSNVFPGPSPNSSGSGIGGNTYGYFNGVIDEMRVYSRSLSASEVTGLYQMGTTKWKTDLSGSTRLQSGQSALMTGGLVGYWSFNGPDVSGTIAYDRSSQGNPGTLTGSPAATIGKVGQAMSFNGLNYVNMGDPGSGVLDFYGSFSISAWVKYTQIPSSGNYWPIAGKGFLGPMKGYGLLLSGDHKGKPVFQARSAPTPVGAVSPVSIADNSWHLLTGVRDHPNSTTHLYVDGALVASNIGVLADYDAGAVPFGVGYRAEADGTWWVFGPGASLVYPCKCSIDEVRVYNRALSAGEVTALYNAGR